MLSPLLLGYPTSKSGFTNAWYTHTPGLSQPTGGAEEQRAQRFAHGTCSGVRTEAEGEGDTQLPPKHEKQPTEPCMFTMGLPAPHGNQPPASSQVFCDLEHPPGSTHSPSCWGPTRKDAEGTILTPCLFQHFVTFCWI